MYPLSVELFRETKPRNRNIESLWTSWKQEIPKKNVHEQVPYNTKSKKWEKHWSKINLHLYDFLGLTAWNDQLIYFTNCCWAYRFIYTRPLHQKCLWSLHWSDSLLRCFAWFTVESVLPSGLLDWSLAHQVRSEILLKVDFHALACLPTENSNLPIKSQEKKRDEIKFSCGFRIFSVQHALRE